MKKFSQKRKGSVLVFALIILTILLVSAITVITVAITEKRSAFATQKSVIAFQAADSAVERIVEIIYRDNSQPIPSIGVGKQPFSATLNVVKDSMKRASSKSCASGKITATNSGEPAYSFGVEFYDENGNVISSCNDTAWRDKAVRLKAEGFYRGSSRVIEIGIRPRENKRCPNIPTIVKDDDNNEYETIEIGTQCWLQQNMRVGQRINSPAPQTNNGVVEKYCYNNDSDNCNDPHQNQGDGGLYTWNEAMKYAGDSQGICPDGWKIPSRADWDNLIAYVGGASAGVKLLPYGSSGFEANLSGIRNILLAFFSRNDWTRFITSSDGSPSSFARFVEINGLGIVTTPQYAKTPVTPFASSVRCIKE